jgi:hypothetical protein
LEDDEVRRLLGDLRDRLHPGGAGADHRDPLAAEVHRLVRPRPGVVALARVVGEPRERWQVRGRDAADRRDEVARRGGAPVVGGDLPAVVRLVVHGPGDGRAELDVAAQVHLVGDEVEVVEDLRLAREALAPRPLVEDLRREVVAEHVVDALAVAAGARVAVPVPGAPHAVAALEHLHRHVELPQVMQHGEAAEARPHHDGVEIRGHGATFLRRTAPRPR